MMKEFKKVLITRGYISTYMIHFNIILPSFLILLNDCLPRNFFSDFCAPHVCHFSISLFFSHPGEHFRPLVLHFLSVHRLWTLYSVVGFISHLRLIISWRLLINLTITREECKWWKTTKVKETTDCITQCVPSIRDVPIEPTDNFWWSRYEILAAGGSPYIDISWFPAMGKKQVAVRRGTRG